MNNAYLINQNSGEKTWLTPKFIIDALGHFNTDPCCPDIMPWQTADRMITKEQDGRTAEWIGRVWLNPPYGKESYPFIKRMATHIGGGVALLFARTDTKIWHDWIFPYAHSILFIQGRLCFYDKNGIKGGSCAVPSVLVSYSQYDTDALKNSGIKGKLIELKHC